MRALTLIACLALNAAAQDKAYDLKLNTPRKTGQKCRLTESNQMKMSMNANGQPAAQNEEKTRFEAVEEVIKSDGQGNAELRWTFSKAEHLEEGETKPYGFQGKTVTVKQVKGKDSEFAYADGGAIAEADLAGLKKAFDEDGDDKAAKALAPPKPVKVGDSWSPDVKEVAEMFDKDMAAGVDVAKSKAKFTLKAIEKRGGSEFGKIEGTIELAMGAMGPLKLETPIVMKLNAELDVCVDGSLPDGVMKLKAEMKGGSNADAGGTQVKLDLDLNVSGEMTKTTVK